MAAKKEADTLAGIIVIIIVVIYLAWTHIVKPIIDWTIELVNQITIFVTQVVFWINQNIALIMIIFSFTTILLLAWLRNRKNEEEQREFEIRKIERQRASEKIKYEDEQIAKGLLKFIDRFGYEKWGTSDEIDGWKRYDDECKRRDEEEKMKQTLLYNVVECINKFTPSRKYRNEFGYHTELQGWLKAHFPSAKVEIQTGASRPDIIIDDIAIEVKGPTDTQALNTLTTKCLKYSKYYKNIICVLFEPNYTNRNFQEIQEGIDRSFPNVSIIEKR